MLFSGWFLDLAQAFCRITSFRRETCSYCLEECYDFGETLYGFPKTAGIIIMILKSLSYNFVCYIFKKSLESGVFPIFCRYTQLYQKLNINNMGGMDKHVVSFVRVFRFTYLNCA